MPIEQVSSDSQSISREQWRAWNRLARRRAESSDRLHKRRAGITAAWVAFSLITCYLATR